MAGKGVAKFTVHK